MPLLLGGVWWLLAPMSLRAGETDRIQPFLEGLARQGMPALGVEYVRGRLADPMLDDKVRGMLELDLARQLVATCESVRDLAEKEKRLNEAHQAFVEFRERRPDHPERGEALLGEATIDLQRGRLLILRSLLPAEQGHAGELRQQARNLFRQAGGHYEEAHKALRAELATLEGFIDERKERALFARRERLTKDEVESEFQAALSTFFLAESLATAPDASAKDQKEAKKLFEDARQRFSQIHQDHRREIAGLFGNLWEGRCLAALGDYRQAGAIFETLLAHENRELESFQREVQHFQLLSMYAQQDYAGVAAKAESWLRVNSDHRDEPSFQGIELVAARALQALGKQPESSESDRRRALLEAEKLLAAVSRTTGPYSAEASRELLVLQRSMGRDAKANSFDELSALGSARLDELADGLEEAKRKEILADAIDKFERSLAAVRPDDDPEAVAGAQLSLAYAYFQAGNLARTIEVAEDLARRTPPVARSNDAGVLALAAYVRAFEQARSAKAGSSDSEAWQTRLRALAKFLAERDPQSVAANQARLIEGKLDLVLGNLDAARSQFESVAPDSPAGSEAASLAGSLLWRELVERPSAPEPERAELRSRSIDKLQLASRAWEGSSETNERRLRLLNDTLLVEALLDAGNIDQAHAVARSMDNLVEDSDLLGSLSADGRSAALVAVLRACWSKGEVPRAIELVDRIEAESHDANQARLAATWVNLVQSMRKDLDKRLEAGAKIETGEQEMLSAFLDKLAEIQKGSSVALTMSIGEVLISLGQFDRARGLLDGALTKGKLDPASTRRAKLLLARANSAVGKHDEAIRQITALLQENPSARDVVWERGEILEKGGKSSDAIKHWQWFLDRLRRVQPRPEELYQVTDRLCAVSLSAVAPMPPADRKKVIEGALRLPTYLLETDRTMPAGWRKTLERRVADLKKAIE